MREVESIPRGSDSLRLVDIRFTISTLKLTNILIIVHEYYVVTCSFDSVSLNATRISLIYGRKMEDTGEGNISPLLPVLCSYHLQDCSLSSVFRPWDILVFERDWTISFLVQFLVLNVHQFRDWTTSSFSGTHIYPGLPGDCVTIWGQWFAEKLAISFELLEIRGAATYCHAGGVTYPVT
jgi:hypothetical protein